MYYQFRNGPQEVDGIKNRTLTAGYIDKEELPALAEKLGFAESTVLACKGNNGKYRSIVETYDKYTFGILHVVGDLNEEDDWIALYITPKLFLVVNLHDRDGSTKKTFEQAINKFNNKKANIAKLILAFFEKLTIEDVRIIEEISTQITDLESRLLGKELDKDFNVTTLKTKNHIQHLHYYYEHILDVVEVLYENDNEIIEYEDMIHINNLMHRLERLNEDTISINSSLEHLQDAYFSYLDVKMNNTMKVLTVLTTIFFPLTIIVGWYGMNFQTMPEFAWKYGYVYVIVLSIIVSIVLVIIGKKGKWFK